MGERCVISGAPGSGKSTTLECLRRRPNVWVSEESARALSSGKLGEQGKLSWNSLIGSATIELRKKNRLIFEEYVLQNDINAFKSAPVKDKSCFFDCGVVEALAYLQLDDISAPGKFLEAVKECRYDRVFFAPEWLQLFRDSSKPDMVAWARKLAGTITGIYESLDYELVTIPRLPPEQRADFIVGHIGK